MKTNKAVRTPQPFTHEGAPAKRINAEQMLKRSVLSCFLWEDEFYEDGQSIAEHILELASKCSPEFVASLAISARSQYNLRHVPLLLLVALIRRGGKIVGDTIFAVIQRADELAELVSLYWRLNPDAKGNITAQMKKGLSRAFTKFNEYQLAKYNRQDAAVKLRDVMFLAHAKPKSRVGDKKNTRIERKEKVPGRTMTPDEAIYHKLASNTLETPNTWESRLTAGENKKEVFTDLIKTDKLGSLALLRNLRGMNEAGVDHDLIKDAIAKANYDRVLPFRFIAAARHAPMFERDLDKAMVASLAEAQKLPGKTLLLVDVSGSMDAQLSGKSDLRRVDAACGLAILLSGICENLRIFSFSNLMVEVPARQGMALRDAINASQPHGGTELGRAVQQAMLMQYDRLIVISDEQAATRVPDPKGRAYMLNVASARNGVGYGPWIHIDGFSEACVTFIREYEANIAS